MRTSATPWMHAEKLACWDGWKRLGLEGITNTTRVRIVYSLDQPKSGDWFSFEWSDARGWDRSRWKGRGPWRHHGAIGGEPFYAVQKLLAFPDAHSGSAYGWVEIKS